MIKFQIFAKISKLIFKDEVSNNNASQIEKKSLGSYIKNARKKSKIKIPDAAQHLKVKITDIEALENDKFSQVSNNLYVVGFINSYMNFLGISKADLISEFGANVYESIRNNNFNNIVAKKEIKLSPGKETFFNFLLISLLMFLLFYFINKNHIKNKSEIFNRVLINEIKSNW